MDRRVKERLVGATILVVLIVLIVPELLSGPKRLGLAPPPAAVGPAEPVGRPAVRNVTVDLATSKATPAEEASAASAASTAAGTPSGAATTTGDAASGEVAAGEAASSAAASSSEAASGDPGAGQAGAGQAAAGVPAPGEGGRLGAEHPAARPPPPTITTLRAQQPAAPVLENEASPPKSASLTSKPGGRPTGTATSKPGKVKSGTTRETVPVETSHHSWAVQLGSFASRANAEKLVQQLKAHDSSAYVSSSGKGPSLLYRVRIGPLADRSAAERVQLKLRKEGLSASLVAP